MKARSARKVTIACLGWGSLIWDPRELALRNNSPDAWLKDGPRLPVEFARESSGGRITLVIVPDGKPVRVLWNEMVGHDLDTARRSLLQREGTGPIGVWPSGSNGYFPYAYRIGRWAKSKGIDAVIWAALHPKFDENCGKVPTVDEVLAYLGALTGGRRDSAERYVRRTPVQIRTLYRTKIERSLGWTYNPAF
jgi:hypothetical protein